MRGLWDSAWLALALAVAVSGPVLSLGVHEAPALLPDEPSLGSFEYLYASAVGDFDASCSSPLIGAGPNATGFFLRTGTALLTVLETTAEILRDSSSGEPLAYTRGADERREQLILAEGTSVRTGDQGWLRSIHTPHSPSWLNETVERLDWAPSHFQAANELPGTLVAGRQATETKRPLATLTLQMTDSTVLKGNTAFVAGAIFEGGVDYAMPEPVRVVEDLRAGPLVRQRVVETFGFLEFGGELVVDASSAEIHCLGLRLRGDGNLTYYGASGSLGHERGGQRVISDEDMRLQGRIDAQEESAVVPPESGAEQFGDYAANAPPETIARTQVSATASPAVPVANLGTPATWTLGMALALAWAAARGWPFAVAFHFTRVSAAKALKHPTRALIHNAAQGQPGVTVLELSKSMGLAYGTMRHHALVLVRAQLLKSMRYGRNVHLYPAEASLPQARRSIMLEHDASARWLAEWLKSNPGSRLEARRALQDERGLSRVGAWKALRRAERAGLVAIGPAPQPPTQTTTGSSAK